MRTAVPPRVAPTPFGTGATLTAAVTGLPRAVLLIRTSSESKGRTFFRVLPGDGRIGACGSSLREPGALRCGACVAVEGPDATAGSRPR
ncbi:hypothetical protein CHE218_03850 [Microbacterium sp. che218]